MTDEQIAFMSENLGKTMTVKEMARYLRVSQQEVILAAEKTGCRGTYFRPTALRTPGLARVAVGVRKAKLIDTYFVEPWPDGLVAWQREHGLLP